MTTTETIEVEVAYALPERQWLVRLALKPDARAEDAVMAAERLDGFPKVLADKPALAIWGRPVQPDETLAEGDRVDILRSLLIDPRSARRQLAAAGQVMGNRLKP